MATQVGSRAAALQVLLILGALTVELGCTPPGPWSDPRLSMADVAGRYGQAGHIGFLELKPSGEYECFVVNGMTADGCATFVGAGVSRGTWSCRGEAIAFDPLTEPEDLVLSLVGASALPIEQDLVLTAQGQEHFLVREGAPGGGVGKPLQSGEPSTGPGGRPGG